MPASNRLNFSKAVSSTIETCKKQMALSGAASPSTSLLRRHAAKHIGSSDIRLLGPVVEAARDEIRLESLISRAEQAVRS